MKTTKLVTGIFSIVLCFFVLMQSCAAGMANALTENGEIGGTAGAIVAACLIIAGIVGIATRKSAKRGGSIASAIFYALGALIGLTCAGSYADLYIWSGLCVVFAVFYIVAAIKAPNIAITDTQAEENAPKKKSPLKVVLIVVAAIVVVILIASLFGGDSGDSNTDESAASGQTNPATDQIEQPSDEGDLGDYHVKILEGDIVEDWDGNRAIRIGFEFTNNSDDTTAFDYAIYPAAYQDGVELETTFISDDKESDNSSKNVKPGATVTCARSYELTSDTSDVELEVGELISFSDEMLVATFTLQ